jgi:hypothetical protein
MYSDHKNLSQRMLDHRVDAGCGPSGVVYGWTVNELAALVIAIWSR